MASDRAVAIPSVAPPRARFGSAMPAMASASSANCQLWWSMRVGWNMPMVDPAKNRQAIANGQAAGATSRRTVRLNDPNSKARGTSGASATAICSACGPVRNRRPSRISPASGKSTSRDQCMLAPSGQFILYWRKSYQSCPASSARTWLMRILSSVSLRTKPVI
jgi:hypothetical protein